MCFTGVYTRARAAAPKAPVLPSATADPFLPTANPLIGGDFDRLPTAESRRTSGGGGVEKDKDVLAALHYTLAQTIDGKAVSDARPSSYRTCAMYQSVQTLIPVFQAP